VAQQCRNIVSFLIQGTYCWSSNCYCKMYTYCRKFTTEEYKIFSLLFFPQFNRRQVRQAIWEFVIHLPGSLLHSQWPESWILKIYML